MAGQAKREHQTITDPRSMRALAHPTRIALLEALGREGPLTATKAAEILDDTPGNMSWHLQTLAKYGYVEESGEGRGRSRPWKIVSAVRDFDTSSADPEISAAGDALESTMAERSYRRLREWWTLRRSHSHEWRRAAFAMESMTYLTPEELNQVGEELAVVIQRYGGRIADRSARPEGSVAVQLVAFGHPLGPVPTGR